MTTTPDRPTVQPGQEYESCQPIYYRSAGPEHVRIRVVSEPITTPGMYGFGKVAVVTLTDDGREVRRRMIAVTVLHTSGTAESGQSRRTGYRLVQHPDGTPAGGGSPR